MQDFSNLANLDQPAFEAERARIINEYIETLSPERQQQARAFQNDLDVKRLGLSTTDFIAYCTLRMRTNLEKINELYAQAVSLVS